MKKIVIFSAFLSPLRSGAEACAEEVTLRLCDRYDITIITAKMRPELPRRDLLQGKVPVIRVGLGMTIDKWLYPLLAPLAAWKQKPDIIHAILESFAGLALLLSKWIGPRAKRILTLQTTNRNFLRGRIIRSPDIVTAISGVLAEQAKSLGRSDVTVIPNGIDVAAFTKARQEYQKVPGRILFVGRLEMMKGVDTLLKVFSSVLKKAGVPLELHIFGDGSQRHSLEKLSRDLQLKDQVHFYGYVPSSELYREYAQAQIFCGLSRSEALGNVFIEAQAGGCVVIAPKVGGISEVMPTYMEKGGAGWELDPMNINKEAEEAILDLLQDSDLQNQLVRAGIENAKRYDWRVIAEKYAAFYQ